MRNLPALRIAVMNDLHIGGPVGGGFQNLFLTGDATTIVNPAVDAINRAGPDLVLIPGDLTHDATSEQLETIAGCLERLDAPWLACKGNHDRETPDAVARFDAVIGRHARPGITRGGELGLPENLAVLVLESAWGDGDAYTPDGAALAVPDAGLIDTALGDLDSQPPDLLLVVSHYPLLSQAGYVASCDGKYAGHVQDGEAILNDLTARAGAVICFCGHNHYHHIISGDRWLQCATGALAEFPSEFRLVSIGENGVQIRTTTASQPVLEAAPPPEFPWVAGRAEDRTFTWRPA